MADPFSTFAGAVSVFDVAIRSCKGLHNASHAYKDAPQEIGQLWDTIRNLESVLRNLRLWVVEYQSSRFATQFHELLPAAVNECTNELNICREELNKLLPSQDESRQLKERSRWVLRKRKIVKLQQRLDAQQKTLDLCLQTVTQRTHLKIHSELGKLGSFQQKALEHSDDLQESQNTISLQLIGIKRNVDSSTTDNKHLNAAIGSVVNNQTQDSQKLDNIMNTLTHLQLAKGCIDSDTVRENLTVDLLTRIIRTEIRGSMIPLMEKTFQKCNASNDQKLDGLCQSIDLLSADVGSRLAAHQEQQSCSMDHKDMARSQDQGTHSTENFDTPYIFPESNTITSPNQDKRIKFWNFGWKMALPIGTFSVRVTLRTKTEAKVIAQAYKIHKGPFSRRYHFAIIFQPAENILRMGGFLLLYKMKQDQQSTYPALCPTVTLFNVIPRDADIFHCIRKNNIDGLKRLLMERKASPNDRDPSGMTVLDVAAGYGDIEACQILLDQGANPDDRSLMRAIYGIYTYKHFRKKHEVYKSDEDYIGVIRILVNSGLEISSAFVWAVTMIALTGAAKVGDERTKNICCSLQELGLDPNDEFHCFDLRDFTRDELLMILCEGSALPWPGFYAAVDLLCSMGVDTNAMSHGLRPLHALFCHTWPEELAGHVLDVAVLLLAHGADPCALDIRGGSVLSKAVLSSQVNKFTEALSRSNMDFSDIAEESQRRQWHFLDPAAESTAVEHSVSEGPSTKGLSRRRVTLRRDEWADGSPERYFKDNINGGSSEGINRLIRQILEEQSLVVSLLQTLKLQRYVLGMGLKNIGCQVPA
ncbi:MAG: hypothetical protein Q9191_006003 [Dirinaria sp. TL-2023a]